MKKRKIILTKTFFVLFCGYKGQYKINGLANSFSFSPYLDGSKIKKNVNFLGWEIKNSIIFLNNEGAYMK